MWEESTIFLILQTAFKATTKRSTTQFTWWMCTLQRCQKTRSMIPSWYHSVASLSQPSSCRSSTQELMLSTIWFREGTQLTWSLLWKAKSLIPSTGSSWLILSTIMSRCSFRKDASSRTRRSWRMLLCKRSKKSAIEDQPLNLPPILKSMLSSLQTSVSIKNL